jgi:hypothetical protein
LQILYLLILKSCVSAFALPLCLLFNRSLTLCVFPDRWKPSFVTPIFKCGKRNDRGIPILSTVGKFFELLVDRLDWLDSIYTDFSKAFDKVRHRLLLNKMSDVEPSSCQWLGSYYSG